MEELKYLKEEWHNGKWRKFMIEKDDKEVQMFVRITQAEAIEMNMGGKHSRFRYVLDKDQELEGFDYKTEKRGNLMAFAKRVGIKFTNTTKDVELRALIEDKLKGTGKKAPEKVDLDADKKELESGQKELKADKESLEAGKGELKTAKESLETEKVDLDADKKALEEKEKAFDEKVKAFEESQKEKK